MPSPGQIAAASRVKSNAFPPSVNLLADFDATTGVTLSTTNVTAWTDRASGYVVSQVVEGRYPTVDSINGRAALVFDGTDDNLTGATALAGLIDQSAPYTAYFLGQLSGNLSSPRAMFGASNSGTAYAYHFHQNTDGYGRGSASVTNNGTQTPGTTNPFDYTAVYTGSNISTWVNGVASLSAAANTVAPVCDLFSIGCLIYGGGIQQPWNGLIGRILIYSVAHDSTTRGAISAGLRTLYGL